MRWRRLAGPLTAIPAALVILYMLAAVAGALIPGASADIPSSAGRSVGLIAGPIHYDILLPIDPALRGRFAFAEEAGVPLSNPRAAYLIVGWGARDFYTTAGSYRDVRAGAVFAGVTGDASVMHLDVAGPLGPMSAVRFLSLSDAQYDAFLTFIEDSFGRGDDGAPIAVADARFGSTDAFFVARGRFNAFRTCNVWIGEALRAAGVRFGLWTPTPYAVRLSLWRFDT